ncbi:MAG: N-methylhydantoinase [Acidimicrobiia bacterium]|jgi:N-methylhydantoinase A/oxoprolinase/acetone carboxylase beta subunit|nr:N-methylhydantoinase [Acidimicrobiia bacterium]
MTIRIGVDVGGTFTKAVAFDTTTGTVVADAVVPTTHEHADGVAGGVVEVVSRLAQEVGAGRVELVTHSTTQAVNALLEGDVATVGMVGMGRAPDLRKARRRTIEPQIQLSDGRPLTTVTAFLDVTRGLDPAIARTTVERLRSEGAQAIAVAEAFAPDDLTNEGAVAEAAAGAGLPVTTSAELTGLYGLELRSVTAALNASILPIALRTAEVVGAGVASAKIDSPVMVMRGDGGATDLAGFRRAPARTLYSGPAASVAGALRSTRITDAVILEVGGTSTNVAAIRRGRPALSYVQVASHATAIRALDVRVLGVAGGSMLRARRNKVYGVGPRSAHIAGYPYACFVGDADFEGATAELVAPRAGDPVDYLVIRLNDGRRVALTNTCAANALGITQPGDYAHGDPELALAAFAIAGKALRLAAPEVARRMLQATTQAIGDLVSTVARDHHLERPGIVAVGGGAGAVGRAVAGGMGLELTVPPNAEVISAIGDALSLVRAERERTFANASAADTERLIAEVEAEAIRAGAGAASLDVRVEHLTDKGAVRVTVTGAVGLSSGAVPGRPPASRDDAVAAARQRGYPDAAALGRYWMSTVSNEGGRIAVFDQYADLVIDIQGEALLPEQRPGPEAVAVVIARRTRRVGPVTITPDAWVISGSRFLQVPDAQPDAIVATAAAVSLDEPATIVIGRE